MKYFLPILVIILLLAFPLVALAQEEPSPTPPDLPAELPPTAEEALGVVVLFLDFAAALAAYYVTRWVRLLPGLNDGEKSKLTGLAADLVAGFFAFVSFGLLAYLGQLAGFLDDNGFWTVLAYIWSAWPASWTFHKARKVASNVGVVYPVFEAEQK